jgi:2-hydroxychromene-2-carboxylate isomerase
MTRSVEFFFDVGSPTAYLASTQLPAICAGAGAALVYRPMLLGGVFQATGNVSPVSVPAKAKYWSIDMDRWAQRYGVPLARNPYFPINTLLLMRAISGVQMRMPERFNDFLRAAFDAIWVDALNLNDAAVTAKMLIDAGFDPAQIMALANDAEVKAALRASTDEAVARGVFGAPTMFVGEQIFFGQDRLDFVAAALKS